MGKMILWICGHCGEQRGFPTDEEADAHGEEHYFANHARTTCRFCGEGITFDGTFWSTLPHGEGSMVIPEHNVCQKAPNYRHESLPHGGLSPEGQ